MIFRGKTHSIIAGLQVVMDSSRIRGGIIRNFVIRHVHHPIVHFIKISKLAYIIFGYILS